MTYYVFMKLSLCMMQILLYSMDSVREWKGFAPNPCCSQNICPLSGTNQSEETKAITNQAARWAFLLESLGGAGTNAVTTPFLPPFPSLPTPVRLWYLRPPGKITSLSFHTNNPTDHDREMLVLAFKIAFSIYESRSVLFDCGSPSPGKYIPFDRTGER